MTRTFRLYTLLRPFGWIYELGTSIRNKLYDIGIFHSSRMDIPVICIGNITVGGTGKTPHTEYAVSLLHQYYRTAVLSRGYGRNSKGFVICQTNSSYRQTGDEPLQVKRRFSQVNVAVCEDRRTGILRLHELCSPQVIILDDAFQHRKVLPSLNILLINYHRNILEDAMLPAGRLRESAAGRKRAQIMVVTKCPLDMSAYDMDCWCKSLKTDASQRVYFTALDYGDTYLLGAPQSPLSIPAQSVLAITGVAGPELMVNELKRRGHRVALMAFPDHHKFSKANIKRIESRLQYMGRDAVVVTTAKDAVRLEEMEIPPSLRQRIWVLPVGVHFLRDAEKFEQQLREHIDTFTKE